MTKEKSDSELWEKYISNPDESLGESERAVWLELQRIIADLLQEPKNKGKVELNFTKSEINHVKKLLKNRNEIVANFNKIIGTTDTWEKTNNFVQAIGKYDFNEVNYVYLLVETSLSRQRGCQLKRGENESI